MYVCPASPLSTRRYEYIEYENGKVLGDKKYCALGTTKVSEAMQQRFMTWHCIILGWLMVALSLLALQLLHVHLWRARQEVWSLLQLKANTVKHHQQHVSFFQSSFFSHQTIFFPGSWREFASTSKTASFICRFKKVNCLSAGESTLQTPDGCPLKTTRFTTREFAMDATTTHSRGIAVKLTWMTWTLPSDMLLWVEKPKKKVFGNLLMSIFSDWCEVSRCRASFESRNARVGD